MKKKVFGRKLSRNLKSRRALSKSLVKALIEHGSIKTTLSKAKFVQKDVEKLVIISKKEGLNAKRLAYSRLGNNKILTDKMFTEVAMAFENTKSGFTRIIKLPKRKGDSADMAKIEWSRKVSSVEGSKTKKAKVKTKSTKIEGKNVKPALTSPGTKSKKVKSKK